MGMWGREATVAKMNKKNLILTSSVDEAGSRMIRANIDAFRQNGIGAFKTKVTLIFCVFRNGAPKHQGAPLLSKMFSF